MGGERRSTRRHRSLLSIATAQWQTRDAREEIHTLIDQLNAVGAGFNFSQDLILKAGLVLAGIGDFAFRVKNFNAENMAILDAKWEDITEALTTAADLLKDFGLNESNMTADSVLIPVAYYLRRRGLTDNYRVKSSSREDRALLRSWVLRSLIKPGIWGSGLDTLLRDLRQTIDDHGAEEFPAAEIEARMAARGKSLVFADELIEDILNLSYGRKRTFAVLAIMFPHVDTRNIHHVDHIFPRAMTHRKRLTGYDDAVILEIQAKRDLLPNLQLLEGPVNVGKSEQNPKEWAASEYPTPVALKNYLERNTLPDDLPQTADDFIEFFKERRDLLAELIKKTLSVRLDQSEEPAVHATSEDG